MSKYNSKKIEIDGIVFDSKLEAEYYLYLQGLKLQKKIIDIHLQPRFILQKEFQKNGKKYRKIEYIADFEVVYMDRVEVIDIKGFETADFKIKKKIFEYSYPERDLKLITKCPKKYGGGWIELEELKKLRKVREIT